MQEPTRAEGVLVLVQEPGAAVGHRASVVLHNEVICGLLGVVFEPAIAVQVLPQLCTKSAVCCLPTIDSHHTQARKYA